MRTPNLNDASKILFVIGSIVASFFSWDVLNHWLHKRKYALESARHFEREPESEKEKRNAESIIQLKAPASDITSPHPHTQALRRVVQALYKDNAGNDKDPHYTVKHSDLARIMRQEVQKASRPWSAGLAVSSWLFTGYNLWLARSYNTAPTLARALPVIAASGAAAGIMTHQYNKPRA